MSEIRSQATPERDELVTYLDRVIDNEAWANTGAEAAKHIEEQLGWSKPRTVNSATELEALAEGSVILVDAGRYGLCAWQKHANGRWCEASHCEESMTSAELRAGNLPTAVLFTPGEAG